MFSIRFTPGISSAFRRAGAFATRVGQGAKNHSAEICAVGSAIGFIAAMVVTAVQTPKAVEVYDRFADNVRKIDEVSKDEGKKQEFLEKYHTEFDDKERGKELAIVYFQTGLRFIKVYAVPATLTLISLAALFAAIGLLREENAGLTLALGSMEMGLKGYRERWKAKAGEEEEKKVWLGLEEPASVTDGEGGGETEDKSGLPVEKERAYGKSPFVFELSKDTAPYFWSEMPEELYSTLKAEQDLWNNFLVSRAADGGTGVVWLNEILTRLDLKNTYAGQFIGWTYSPDGTGQIGDNFIDFGITDITEKGGLPVFLLNFNATTILDKVRIPET